MKTNSVFEVWCNDDSMPSMYYWKRILRQIETDKGNRIYLSVIRLQRFRFKSSILLQCCANVRIAWSATDWHPLSESCFKNPPHLLAMFSTTTPYSPLKKCENIACHIVITVLPQHLFENWTGQYTANCSHLMPECSSIWILGHNDIMIQYPRRKILWCKQSKITVC